MGYKFGGTGFDLIVKLPDKIDRLEEDWQIYPGEKCYYNFLSRGCSRKCDFCFVWRKEGSIYQYRTLDYVLQQMKKWKFTRVKFLDNNIFFLPNCDEILQSLIDNKVTAQFNQGLDMRIMTEKKAELLSKMNQFGEHIFAFDDIRYKDIMDVKFKIYKKFNPRNWRAKFFVYCNANMPVKDVLWRINWCKKNKALVYLMRDKNCYDSPLKKFYTMLTHYCQAPGIFKQYSIIQHIRHNTKDKDRRLEFTNIYTQAKNYKLFQ